VTKADIIAEITQRTGLGKEGVQQVVEEFFELVKEKMEEGDSLYVRGFGSFVNKYRARKQARDIAKGEPIWIEAHYVPSFKPSKTFVERIKNNEKMLAQASLRSQEAAKTVKTPAKTTSKTLKA
jgi:DNA-binding protein HU-beta